MHTLDVIAAPAVVSGRPVLPPVLARIGPLEVGLAQSAAQIEAARALRYEVFVAEMGADLRTADPATRTESDRFDAVCDHIIVSDTRLLGLDGRPRVVGAYRALPPEKAGSGYYSQSEFDVKALIARHEGLRFCEVGRSCVAVTHRSMRTIEALWYGLWTYACRHRIDVYFGAASFPGADPDSHALALSYLHHHVRAPRDWQVDAHPMGAAAMDRRPVAKADRLAALRAMPPLVRGYLRVNAHVGRTAFIDPQFGTTDVMILARLARVPPAYRTRVVRLTGHEPPPPGPDPANRPLTVGTAGNLQ